jgi:hypothetical protein
MLQGDDKHTHWRFQGGPHMLSACSTPYPKWKAMPSQQAGSMKRHWIPQLTELKVCMVAGAT